MIRLTIGDILNILGDARRHIINERFKGGGLCPLVSCLITDYCFRYYIDEIRRVTKGRSYLFNVSNAEISNYIHLFTYENAEKYCDGELNGPYEFWWRKDIRDNPIQRLEFVNWMIDQYKTL